MPRNKCVHCTAQAQFSKEETGYDGVMMRLGMHSYCIRKYLKRNKIKFHDFNFFSTIYRASGYFHGRRLLLFGGGVRRSMEHFPRSTAPRSTLHVHELPGPCWKHRLRSKDWTRLYLSVVCAERNWKLKNQITLNLFWRTLSLDNVGCYLTTNTQQNAAFSNQLEEPSPRWPF